MDTVGILFDACLGRCIWNSFLDFHSTRADFVCWNWRKLVYSLGVYHDTMDVHHSARDGGELCCISPSKHRYTFATV